MIESKNNSVESDHLNLRKMESILTELGVKESHVRIAIQRAAMTGESLPKIMSDYGFLSGDQVADAVSRMTDFEYYNSTRMEQVSLADIEGITMGMYQRFVPVGRAEDETLLIAVPDETIINNAKNEFYKERVRFVIAAEYSIQALHRKYFAKTEQAFDDAVSDFMEEAHGAGRMQEEDSGKARIVFGTLIRHACYSGASDLYLYKSEHVGVIKLKINGVGQLFRSIDPHLFDRLLNKLVTDNSKVDDLRRAPQESVLEFSEEDKRIYEDITTRFRFRLELTESRGVRNAVIRMLDKQSNATQLDRLGFDASTMSAIHRMSNAATGLIIVTGPTGSGKTTSLYAMLKEIDPVERSIQSIENPIEYRHGLWQQYELRKDAENEGEEFNVWLKALLRNAPDVILMGEVRDKNVAQILLDAANTGHLAFTTLHTNTAALALARLKRLEVDQQTLASVLLGILAQRLVRVLCPFCKKVDEREETKNELEAANSYLRTFSPCRQGEGCSHCDFSGYKGRRIIYELLTVTPEVRQLIEENVAPSIIGQKGIPRDATMWANGLKMVADGSTSFDEVLRVSVKD